MSCPHRLTPVCIAAPVRKVLLDARLPVALLRQLDGWSPAASRLLEFTDQQIPLTERASDSLDWAVITLPTAGDIDTLLPALLRVARQGLIRLT
ncbi:MAG: hypothetical protein CFE49_07510 [Pseudomonas sp. PGPPP3]|jgi:hypothetical protein|nr:MAG: hypothetical protein CFE49_07510 [Pseudomonas sp. PGPPP3]